MMSRLRFVALSLGCLVLLASCTPSTVKVARQHYDRGRILLSQGKNGEAEAEFREALKLKPDYAEAHEGLGFALGVIVKPEAPPVGGQATNFLGVVMVNMETEKEFREAIRLNPKLYMSHAGLAMVLTLKSASSGIESPTRKEADGELQEAFRLRPKDVYFCNKLLELFNEEPFGKRELSRQTVTVCQKLIELEPGKAKPYVQLGDALLSQSRYMEAEDAFRKALELQPDIPEAYVGIGDSYELQGRDREAEQVYQTAILRNPKHPEAYRALGRLYKNRFRYTEAEQAFRDLVKASPDDYQGYKDLVDVLESQGKNAETEDAYRQMVRLNPDDAESHFNLGLVLYESLKKYPEAEKEFREVIRLMPEMSEAHDNLGIMLYRQGKYDEAIAEYREAVRLKPEGSEPHNNLGIALEDQGKLEEAIPEFQTANELGPNNPGVLGNLARALDKQGQRKEARGYWERALPLEEDPATVDSIRMRLAEPD